MFSQLRAKLGLKPLQLDTDSSTKASAGDELALNNFTQLRQQQQQELEQQAIQERLEKYGHLYLIP